VCAQRPEDLLKDDTAAEREHSRHILDEQRLWLKLVEEANVMLEEAVARVL
jgi:hypothetical protein